MTSGPLSLGIDSIGGVELAGEPEDVEQARVQSEVRPARATPFRGSRRFDSSAGHVEDGNARDLDIRSGRLIVEADFALE